METDTHSRTPEEELYNLLQQKSLRQVQQMSGKVWTDYNPHDPGVTILDLLNYVLWELDYQLSFDLEDYLTQIAGCFDPTRHGLFNSQAVFSVSPVTAEDYQKMISSAFTDIEEVRVEPYTPASADPYCCNGLYDIKIRLSVWSDNTIRQAYLEQEITRLFHRNRNLCESLHRIQFICDKKASRSDFLYGLERYAGTLPDLAATAGSSIPKGVYRDIYTYYSVQHDFPDCYGINTWGISPSATDLRKAQAHQLKGYLLLFDLLFGEGLNEVKDLPEWMTLTSHLPVERIPVLNHDPLLQWEALVDVDRHTEVDCTRRKTLTKEKGIWLDVLDKLYGENSNPDFLQQFTYSANTEQENVARRVAFLQQIPDWGRNRFKGIDLYDISPAGRSGMEVYLASLLGFTASAGHPVLNLYASYNLRILDDKAFFSKYNWLLDYDLIMPSSPGLSLEDFLKGIEPVEQPWSDTAYEWLRKKIPLLEHGFLFESFLREGVRIEGYKKLYMPVGNSWLLLLYYETTGEWKSLGRFLSEEEVSRVVNSLRSFLLMLNKRSETVYLVEHLLLSPIWQKQEREELRKQKEEVEDQVDQSDEIDQVENSLEFERLPLDFSLTVVLTGGTVRMADFQFRKEVEALILDRIPAHLNVSVLWLSFGHLMWFEQLYFDWRKALSLSNTVRINKLSGMLTAYLVDLRKKYDNNR